MQFGYCKRQNPDNIFKNLCLKGEIEKALELVTISEDSLAISQIYWIIQGCINRRDIVKVLQPNAFVWSAAISAHAYLGESVLHHFFIRSRDTAVWNSIIGGYLQEEHAEKVLQLFKQMQLEGVEPNTSSFIGVLKACCFLKSLNDGMMVHSCMSCGLIKPDLFVINTLIDMYAKCGNIFYACHVFEDYENRDIVTWNIMISGYSQNCHYKDVLLIFDRMQQEGIEPNDVTWNVIIAAQAQFGYCQEVVHMLQRMQRRGFIPDLVTCNALLSVFCQRGYSPVALSLFQYMLETGISPSKATFLSAMKACASLAAIHEGQICNELIIENGFESDIMIGCSLIDMYAHCGSLEHANLVFRKLKMHNVVVWTSLIAGFVQCSKYNMALEVFGRMLREGWKPTDVTFVSVLSACSYAGLIDEGCSYFELMQAGYGISPTVQHYNCLANIFAAAGYLFEAQQMLLSMPVDHNIIGWTNLLIQCEKHKEMGIARQCFEKAVSIDCMHASFYTIMANIYSDVGMNENAEQIRTMRRNAYLCTKKSSEKALPVLCEDSSHEQT